jgi:hypothetical protein
MPSSIYVGATEPRRMAITVDEGVFADITIAGVALRTDANDIPDADPSAATIGDFSEIALDDPDVMPVFGPRDGDIDHTTFADAGGTADLQCFILLRTADYDFIRKPDVLTVLGTPPA